MDYETIIVKKEDNITTITLNRPEKLNAMNVEMINELTLALKVIGQDGDVRVVILTGSGRGFCSGGDLSMETYQTTDVAKSFRFLDKVAQMILQLKTIPQPVIASVNGVAAGGGCNIALASDMIIASEEAQFSQIYINNNLHPDAGGTYFLPRQVGSAIAMELMLTGRMVGAEEAFRIGLVNNVVPAEGLENATKELAKTIASASPVVTRMIKSSIYAGLSSDLPAALNNEAKAAVLIKSARLSKLMKKKFVENEK